MLAPRLESVIAEKKGEVILAKVDIDENTDLALDYEVILYFIFSFVLNLEQVPIDLFMARSSCGYRNYHTDISVFIMMCNNCFL